MASAPSFVAENELLEPEIGSFPDAEEIKDNGIFAFDNFTISIPKVDDSIISNIELDPSYEEEVLDIDSAEEAEDQRQPQSPQIHVEGSADLANDDTNTDREYATQKLIQQFLAGIHGCSARSHAHHRVQIHDTPRHICEYGVDMDAD
ncbi:hypothetical protein Forpe1208_v011933 [Fusarium oxysporum f. sp. rapae]|uniref:Uncharacterized protein n=1 Tax=Fusarium oxysporum f. sp. rapae TaxID=485398 RepID=A0A8J5NM20_FUSOX|nr:hypothetical protein Forpe1208_v011933 [Fusarium oxysporum f. sp. rapae]